MTTTSLLAEFLFRFRGRQCLVACQVSLDGGNQAQIALYSVSCLVFSKVKKNKNEANQPINSPTNQPTRHNIISQSYTQSINQSAKPYTSQQIHKSNNRSTNERFDRSFNPSIDQSPNQSLNQSIVQSNSNWATGNGSIKLLTTDVPHLASSTLPTTSPPPIVPI